MKNPLERNKPQQALLQFSNVSFSFLTKQGERAVLNDLSFSVAKNEIVGLQGDSGGGKSLMTSLALNHIDKRIKFSFSGNLSFQAGSENIRLFPDPKYRNRKIYGKHIAHVGQQPRSALDPIISCGKQLLQAYRSHEKRGKKEALLRIDECLEEVDLVNVGHLMKAYPHELSGGELQRLNIAMALLHKPALIIADEPTTNLDKLLEDRIIEIFRRINQENETAIWLISHDGQLLEKICHRVEYLEKGTVVNKAPCSKDIFHLERRTSTLKEEHLLSAQKLSYLHGNSSNGIKGLSFHLRKGEFLGLVGPSGSGKSTLARCLVKLYDYSGNISPSYASGKVQMIFQQPQQALNPLQRIGKAVEEVHETHHKNQDSKRAAIDLLNQVGLGETCYLRRPSELSGGQMQRVCIAKALASSPQILICDEAVSALDQRIKQEIIALLLQIQEARSLSIIFISHDLALTEKVSHRIITLKNGEIEKEYIPK